MLTIFLLSYKEDSNIYVKEIFVEKALELD